MSFLDWIGSWGVNEFQNLAIAAGFFLNAYNTNAERNDRKVDTELTLAAAHRDIWKDAPTNPNLSRILDPAADPKSEPLSPIEEWHMRFVILHTRAAFKARKTHLKFGDDNFELDVGLHFSLPIPAEAWKASRQFLDKEFVVFVEKCVAEQGRR